MFIIHGFLKHADKDNFENGCSLEDSYSFALDYSATADTLADALKKIEQDHGFDSDSRTGVGEIDPGRADYQRTENADGCDPTPTEMEKWKAGEIDLWLCDYSFTIYEAQPVTGIEVN